MLTLKEAARIPLSDKTIKSRECKYRLLFKKKKKLKSLLESCLFSLCLTISENANNWYVSQLSIFARIVEKTFSCVEELLDFVPLYNTTMSVDVLSKLFIKL